MPADQIVAALVAISFAAGLNLYATIASLGILERAGVLALPPALHLLSLGEDGVAIGLSWLATAHPYIAAAIAPSGVAAAFFLIRLVSRSVKTFIHDLFRS